MLKKQQADYFCEQYTEQNVLLMTTFFKYILFTTVDF